MRDVAILSAVRTPIGRAPKGNLRQTRPDDLGGLVVNEALVRAGVEVALRELDRLADVARPLGFEGLDARCTARAELDPDLRLRLQSRLSHRFRQAYEIFGGERDEAARDLDDVEAELAALLEVTLNGVAALREHVLEKAAGRDLDPMLVADVVQGAYCVLRHQRE